MTARKHLLIGASFLVAPLSVQAAEIGVGAFTSPTTVGFGNPGAPGGYDLVAEGLAIAPVTFTSATGNGIRWWGAGTVFNDCIGGCVTTNDFGANTLSASLTQSYNMVGLYVGQATAYDLTVSFFDTANVLLGSVNVSGASDGVSFAGWEHTSAIGRVDIINANANNFVLAAQSGLFQNSNAVPEPATWALLIAGFGLVGSALRRRRRTVDLIYC